MKYGWRERISGALILLALAVIFLPLLFDDPAPREERPSPTMTIEQPIEVPHTRPDAPTPPDGLSADDRSSSADGAAATDEVTSVTVGQGDDAADTSAATSETEPAPEPASTPEPRQESAQSSEPESTPEPEPAPQAEPEAPADDPIAALAREADERMAAASPTHQAVSGGDWAVQVGSFGEPANAERLAARLEEQGFPAYRRPRDNDLTTVYVGPYASSEVAERARGELKAGLNLQGLLVEAK